jgi:hypothetical protein
MTTTIPLRATPPQPSPGTDSEQAIDARETGRVMATVLLAAGPAAAPAVARANQGLARLGRAPLRDRDFVVSTPEELAPRIPVELRADLAELLLDLAAGE